MSSLNLNPRKPKTLLQWPDFASNFDVPLPQLLNALDQTQYLDPGELMSGQALQLRVLLNWAVKATSHYRSYSSFLETIENSSSLDEFFGNWRQIPLLDKETLRTAPKTLMAPSLPPRQQPIKVSKSSGSTGIPVQVIKSRQSDIFWHAMNVREHLWHNRDFRKNMSTIRHLRTDLRNPEGNTFSHWAHESYQPKHSCRCSLMHIGYPLDDIARWLEKENPNYLLTYPSIIRQLFEEYPDPRKALDNMEQILFISEPLDDETREIVEQYGIATSNVYSANEVGQMGIECEHNKLHIQSETMLVEILREDGSPCSTGETGKVVVTPLHNFAQPLLRYNIGDYATVGEPCKCGRTLPTLSNVKGRVRNLVRTPEGKTWWPGALGKMRRIEPVIQTQYVQVSEDTIQLNIRLTRPPTKDEEDQIRDTALSVLKYPFNIVINPVDKIERSKSGKFEEFLSLIAG